MSHFEPPPPPPMPEDFEQGPKMVDLSTPALFLIIFGCLGILMAFMGLFPILFGQGTSYDEILNTPEFRELFGDNEMLQSIFAFLGSKTYQSFNVLLSFVASILILIGGLKMKNGTSYTWAMVGAGVAAFPCISSCCCLDIPVGCWALYLLTREGVRDLFEQ